MSNSDQEFWERFEKISPSVEVDSPTAKQKTGRASRVRTGWEGVGADILESLKTAPSALGEALKQLPQSAVSAGKEAVTDPLRAGGQIGAGVLEGLKGAYNIPWNIADYLASKDIGRYRDVADITRRLKIGETGLQEGIFGEDQPGDPFLRGIGEFTPYARAGRLAKGAEGVGKRAAAAGAYGIGQEEDPIHAALLSLGGEAATKGLSAIPKLRPSKFITSPLSAEELEESLKITKGTKTDLGEVIENPFLKEQFQNKISKFPFSGAPQAMQETAAVITEKGTDLLDNLLGDADPAYIHEDLVNALKEAKTQVETQKRQKFSIPNERASKIGLKVGRDNFSKTAQNVLGELKESPELLREIDKGLLSSLESYADLQESQALKASNIFRGKLGEKAHQAFREGDKHTHGVYKNLQNALDKDIKMAIEESGDSQLKNSHEDAMDFYRKEVVPFEDNDIMTYTNRGGDPDLLLSKFLKTSRLTDRANLLNKLQEKLPSDKKNLLAYAHFSRALEDDGINPSKLRTLYKKLGPKQKDALIPNTEMRNQFKDFSSLVNKNKEPLNLMFNPPTGQRLAAGLPDAASAAGAGLGALLSGSLPIFLGVGGAPILGARLLTKYLTSPSQREKLVSKMIEQKRKPQRESLAPALRDITRTMLESSGNL